MLIHSNTFFSLISTPMLACLCSFVEQYHEHRSTHLLEVMIRMCLTHTFFYWCKSPIEVLIISSAKSAQSRGVVHHTWPSSLLVFTNISAQLGTGTSKKNGYSIVVLTIEKDPFSKDIFSNFSPFLHENKEKSRA